MKVNKKYYDDWDDEDDGLPRIISVAEFLGNPSILPEEVIESVVRQVLVFLQEMQMHKWI